MLLNLERARAKMEEHGLDAIVGALHENVLYLTDNEAHHNLSHFSMRDRERDFFAILPRNPDIPPTYIPVITIAGYLVDQPTWMPQVWVMDTGTRAEVIEGAELGEDERRYLGVLDEICAHRLPLPPERALATALKELGLAKATIGVDDMRVALRVDATGLVDTHWMDAYEVFREIRAVKTPEELHRLRQAFVNNDVGMDAIFRNARPGISWRELKLTFDRTVLELGSWPRCWAGGCGPWPYRHALFQVDAPAMQYHIKAGDIIRIDVESTYKHYWADTCRVGIVDRPTPESYKRTFDALNAARDEFRPLLRPGTPCREIARVYTETVKKFNLPGFRRGFGHGIGLQWYEWPSIGAESDHRLEEGMVINVEGGPYAVGWGGVNLEDTYLITRNGYELWTRDNNRMWEV